MNRVKNLRTTLDQTSQRQNVRNNQQVNFLPSVQSHLLAIPYYHKLRNVHVTLGTWRVFEGSAAGHETNYEQSESKKLVYTAKKSASR